jgi:DNA-binding MarR family transcriptional regulator
MHILKYWWYDRERPFPKKRTIAECIGKSESTVQRSIRKMEKSGLIKREERYDTKNNARRSNFHRLDGLVKKANELGRFAKEVKEQRSKQDAEIRKSKKQTDLGLVRSEKKRDAE